MDRYQQRSDPSPRDRAANILLVAACTLFFLYVIALIFVAIEGRPGEADETARASRAEEMTVDR